MEGKGKVGNLGFVSPKNVWKKFPKIMFPLMVGFSW